MVAERTRGFSRTRREILGDDERGDVFDVADS
jgi:hypothetical protein